MCDNEYLFPAKDSDSVKLKNYTVVISSSLTPEECYCSTYDLVYTENGEKRVVLTRNNNLPKFYSRFNFVNLSELRKLDPEECLENGTMVLKDFFSNHLPIYLIKIGERT